MTHQPARRRVLHRLEDGCDSRHTLFECFATTVLAASSGIAASTPKSLTAAIRPPQTKIGSPMQHMDVPTTIVSHI